MSLLTVGSLWTSSTSLRPLEKAIEEACWGFRDQVEASMWRLYTLPTSPPTAVSRQGRGLGCGMIELDFLWWPCGLGLTSWRGCVRQGVSLRTTVISDTHASLWSPWVTGTGNCLCWWGKTALLRQPRKGWLMLGCLSDGGDLQGLVS